MRFATGSSDQSELCWFLTPTSEAAMATVSEPYTIAERRRTIKRIPSRRKGAAMQRRRPGTATSGRGQGSPPPGYFSVELALVFLCVAASLAFLPLVLPPLSPPPFLLLLVPVCLLAVLVALAFVPLDAQSYLVGSSRS